MGCDQSPKRKDKRDIRLLQLILEEQKLTLKSLLVMADESILKLKAGNNTGS